MNAMQHILPLKGWSGFLKEAVKFIQNDKTGKIEIAKHNLQYRLILDTPDWPFSALLVFKDKTIKVFAVSESIMNDLENWDAKLTLPAPVALELFIGNFKPTIRSLFHGEVKIKKLLKLRKVLWFIKFSIQFYKNNRGLARSMFWKMYNADH